MKRIALLLACLLLATSVSAQSIFVPPYRGFSFVPIVQPASASEGTVYYDSSARAFEICVSTTCTGSGWVKVASGNALPTGVATGSVLVSNGVGAAPVYSATPSVTSIALGNGTAGCPSLSFTTDGCASAGTGWYLGATGQGYFTSAGTVLAGVNNAGYETIANRGYNFSSGNTAPDAASIDTQLLRSAAGFVSVTSGFVAGTYQSSAAKVLLKGTGTGATQVAMAQTTPPTCATNCGTSPTITGTDTAGTILMGATGSPASGFILTFNGTWAAAPACNVWMAKAGMVVGKQPMTIVTSTTTMTVVTQSGTAPANADLYGYNCWGTQ